MKSQETSKWIKGLNVKPETRELLADAIGSALHYAGKSPLDRTAFAQELGPTIEKQDFIKPKCCRSKQAMHRGRGRERMGENLCQLYIRQRMNIQKVQRTQKPKRNKNQKPGA